jgi:hyperosmotically inducible protein
MKTTKILAAGLLSLSALAACDDTSTNTNGTGTRNATDSTPPATSPATTPPATTPAPGAPENTGLNKRDASGANKTPMDQANNQADIDITANIRKAIVDDDAMSTNAENCKIITDKGVVTLRGVVDSDAERDAIEAKAKAVAGVVRVENLLEVKKPS